MKNLNKPEDMDGRCVCESCNSSILLKHFEKCKKCGSRAYHSTPRELKPKVSEEKDDI